MSEQLELHVANLDCDHDAAALRRGFQNVSGVSDLQVLPKAAKVRVTFDAAVTNGEAIEAHLREIGFPPQPLRSTSSLPRPWQNPKVLTSAGSGVLLLIGWLVDRSGGETVGPLLYIASAVSGGWYFGREAIEELIFEREIGIELLMLVAAVVAIVMGQAGEGAMLAFLYSISEAAEGYTEEKTRSAIRALMDLTPKTALVRRRNGREEPVPVETLQIGDLFIVKPGQSVATDGIVEAGESSVNQAPVTGESVPVHKAPGAQVFAGTINEEGALEIRATKTFADNTVSRIIHMVEEAQEQKGRSQRFIERFGSRYSPAVLLAGLLLAVVPSLITGNWVQWIERATVFVVSAAPCALVISIPITLVATLGTGARKGVLIKGGVYVEELAKVTVVAMDKTGTLTRGQPEVTSVIAAQEESLSADQAVSLAAGIERWSQHPLARAVLRYAESRGLPVPEATGFHSITGLGAAGLIDGRRVYVGSPELFEHRLRVKPGPLTPEIARLQELGNTVVLVGDDTRIEGLIAIRDNLRVNARTALEGLRRAGVTRIVMLTGDNARTARAIADEAGVDDVYADLKPDQKVEKVRELSAQYGHVAMVGDGVNDAPALAAATVGVAMGAAGTDVALETADVALMADDLERLAYALTLAHRTQRVVRQNLALSITVIAVLIVGAVAGAFNLPIAVLGHEISEFVVIGSGLRMLRA